MASGSWRRRPPPMERSTVTGSSIGASRAQREILFWRSRDRSLTSSAPRNRRRSDSQVKRKRRCTSPAGLVIARVRLVHRSWSSKRHRTEITAMSCSMPDETSERTRRAGNKVADDRDRMSCDRVYLKTPFARTTLATLCSKDGQRTVHFTRRRPDTRRELHEVFTSFCMLYTVFADAWNSCFSASVIRIRTIFVMPLSPMEHGSDRNTS